MVKGLYTAWSGMVNEMNQLDVMTNNLANADTNGYKKEGATSQTFDEHLAVKIRDMSDDGLPVSLGRVTPGVMIGETYTDYSQGSFRVTDSQYDVALDGDGFFAVSFTGKDGVTTAKYTRDGAFTVNTDGYLVTKDGDYVLNQAGAQNGDPGADNFIRLDPNQEFKIDEKGFIWQNDQIVDQLGTVDFEDYNYLEKYGENLYQTVDGAVSTVSNARVRQGYIEASNVNVVTEMVNMITITRAYESNQKVIQTVDGMLDKAVNNVGRV